MFRGALHRCLPRTTSLFANSNNIPLRIPPPHATDMSRSPITPSPPNSDTASPVSDDDKHLHSLPPSPKKPELPQPAVRSPGFPTREDCWSEDATQTLIDAWGALYEELHRKNLHRKDWREVADAVNAIQATSLKLRRTDVQCKNRIDTVKKKYKIEKSKVVQSNGRYSSTWPHFRSVDALIGDTFYKANNRNSNYHSRSHRRRVSLSPEVSSSPPPPAKAFIHYRMSAPAMIHHKEKDQAFSDLLVPPWSVPVGPRSKRSMTNFSVMAAAAAVMKAKEDEEKDSGAWGRRLLAVGMKRKGQISEKGTVVEGYRRLADAITSLGKTYEKVEVAKQRWMVELEKQRMQFAKELEIQRMKLFIESQVQFEKLN